jgi:hypothetical protein
MKDIKQFLEDVKAQMITEEGIRSFLLSLNNEEFITMISTNMDNDLKGIADIDVERMTQNHASVISEIIADLTIEEKLKSLSNISNDFYTVEQMIFKTLPIEKAVELFLNNPNKYKEEIEAYIETPRQSKEKDHLICSILSNKDLYKLFSEEDRIIFKSLISDEILFLDEKYNICNVTEEEIKNEVARYLANIEYKKDSCINRGIHQKISSKNLYLIFNEVNKGLERIDNPTLTEKELVEYLELPFEKAVLFLDNSLNLTDEEITDILTSNYPDKKDLISKKDITQLTNIIEDYDLPEVDLLTFEK